MVEFNAAVASLDEATVRRLLIKAARDDPTLAGIIMGEVSSKKLKESQEQVDFSTFVSHAERSVDRGLRNKPSKQFEMAYDVVSDVKDAIRSIEEKVMPHSSFETKFGALTALCEIGELVIDAGEEIGNTLKQSFSAEAKLEDAMKAILSCMTDAERASLRTRQEGMDLGESFEAVIAAGDGYGMFSELKSIHKKHFT